MEDLVREMGFADLREFNRLVSLVDISTPEKMDLFLAWQQNDGTKMGLLKLFVIVVSYGGGTNSTSVLLGLAENGIAPAMIMMADTGDERKHTYAHLDTMQEWCRTMGFPPIVTVTNQLPQGIKDGSLYYECLRLGTLPAKTFGHSSCSMKWKVEPQMRYLRKWMADNGNPHVINIIGYDADEIHRMEKAEAAIAKKREEDPNFRSYETKWYPLIEWGWGRDECVDAIDRWNIPRPGKSSCFMCPSMKKHEVIALSREEPDKYHMAVALERRALAGEGQAPAARVKGLGRHWNWETLEGTDTAVPETDCGCYDGDG